MSSFTFGETVTLVTRTLASTRDAFGNDQYVETTVTVDNCPVWPTGSTETVQAEEQVTTGLTVILPAASDVSALDAVIVRGDKYEVTGDPGVFESPFTGLNPGIEVHLTRATG